MMTCKQYIFKLTSGQLADAGMGERLWATQHKLMCRHCRAFTHNDKQLDAVLQAYQTRLTQPDAPPDDQNA